MVGCLYARSRPPPDNNAVCIKLCDESGAFTGVSDAIVFTVSPDATAQVRRRGFGIKPAGGSFFAAVAYFLDGRMVYSHGRIPLRQAVSARTGYAQGIYISRKSQYDCGRIVLTTDSPR